MGTAGKPTSPGILDNWKTDDRTYTSYADIPYPKTIDSALCPTAFTRVAGWVRRWAIMIVLAKRPTWRQIVIRYQPKGIRGNDRAIIYVAIEIVSEGLILRRESPTTRIIVSIAD